MKKTSRFVELGGLIPLIACAWLVFLAANHSALAQAGTEESIVVTGEEVPTAYGAPPGFSRSRFSNTTQAYVLPPWAFFFGEIYEGQGFRHGPPDHLFTQEIEMGLPYRFGVAAEAQFERFNGGGGARTVSLEARWALADWNKIPLNPTLFAEYKFGVGTIRHEEGPPPPPGEEEEEESGPPKVPDAYEFRLLLAQDFGERVEWAMNWFFEKENTGDRGREWGFSQSVMTPVLLPLGSRHRRLVSTSRHCSAARTTRRWLMFLLPFPGSSAANAPKPKRPCPRGFVTTPTLLSPVAVREKK